MKRSKKKSNLELIDDIIDEFDFERVRKVMIMLNWQWAQTADVPSVLEMKKTARNLLRRMCEESDLDFYGTGGFEVIRSDQGLELRFVVAETWGPVRRDGTIKGLILE